MPLTGLFAAGVCNADAAHALAAFSSQYPQFHNGAVVSIVGAGVDGAGHVFGSLVSQNMLSGAYTWTWLDIPLVACDPLTSPISLSNIFTVPPLPDVSTVWALGFITPMVVYMTAWGYGILLDFISRR